MKRNKGTAQKICFVIFVIALLIDTVISGLFAWFQASYGVTFREIIYTIRSPLSGANNDFFLTASGYVLPKLVIFAAVLAAAVFVFFMLERSVSMELTLGIGRKDKETQKLDGVKALKVLFFVLVVGYSVYMLISINSRLEITKFISDYNARTELYEDYYVMPEPDKITCDRPNNLLYIYMESMETTYASKEAGGEQAEINYIPNLTKLAQDNISFSDEEGLGGFVSAKNTDWTMAALWATETGAAFNFPIEGNSDFGDQEHFSKNSVTLGDILNEKGYYQEFLCGSDATFGGRKAFFEQHGNFRIYDKFTAEEEGYLLPTEEVNWGLEDWRLYEIAKDELTRMAALDQPFNMTMLTVDTHHYDGWICPYCDDTYPDQLANVLICADKQIQDFIDWCSQQEWYEDTLIVIQGDHPRMDQSLVNKAKDRMVYNCFINSVYDKDKASLKMKNRSWNTMDMFPTVLSGMGYKIEGDRLGLGTDMFSGKATLCEELGSDHIDDEVQKYSQFYADRFY
ncbi:MAG: LTA synthase family protein [Lachnospiraceae bacterium]|nr:LTA synthase family protein [Lachnospiraceae bacterium]